MKVLTLWPPSVPSYFNAGHHLAVFMLASYLRRHAGHEVVAKDAGALNYTWKDYASLLVREEFDAVVIVADFDTAEGVRRALEYTRRLSPESQCVIVGRLAGYAEAFLRNLQPDAIVVSGDPEPAVAAVLALQDGDPVPAGVQRRDGTSWLVGPGSLTLPGDGWELPDTSEIPYEDYQRLYVDDDRRFCGIAGVARHELVVPVSRGCPIGCHFCDVPRLQGRPDRRLDVQRVWAYIRQEWSSERFSYVSFYSPTFTLDRRWVEDFCDLAVTGEIPWKCTTTVHHLDDDLVRRMAASGCVRISVGIETIVERIQDLLPRSKHQPLISVRALAELCEALGVELNCFVVLGLPSATETDDAYTMSTLQALGVRVRPTLYTPYDQLDTAHDEAAVSRFNRQTWADANGYADDLATLYRHLHGPQSYAFTSAHAVDRAANGRV